MNTCINININGSPTKDPPVLSVFQEHWSPLLEDASFSLGKL